MSGNFILRAAAGTDAGRKHNVNQDNAFAYVRDPELGKSRGLFIVADGMGGHKAGEIASQLAVETIHQELVWFLMQSDEEDTQPSYPAIGQEGTSETEQNLLEKRLLLAIQQANRRITQYAESNPIDAGNLGTTITCALIDENQAIIVNIGDSRTYLLRGGKLYQITEDHSYVGHLVREGQLAPEGDGIWRINMESGAERLLFSVSEIAQFDPLESMKNAEHYFNHILFNPDGTRFMFFHVWLNNDKKRFIRLITCNLDGEDRYALINEGHVSHYTWKSNDELLAYSTHKDTGRNYHLYKDMSDHREVVGKGVLDQDGHPSYSPHGALLLTDTYHDKYRDQHLLIYDPQSEKLYSLGSYYGPTEFRGDVRCDLHPRWSPSGRYICIDTPHNGRRAMYVLDINDLFVNEH